MGHKQTKSRFLKLAFCYLTKQATRAALFASTKTFCIVFPVSFIGFKRDYQDMEHYSHFSSRKRKARCKERDRLQAGIHFTSND